MAMHPKIREQHIAVFGETGSGKTVLASSFFGPAQEKPAANGLWDLVADGGRQPGHSALQELSRHARPRDGACT
jgi:ABC-type glutathione transport system ATPase component